VRSVDDSIGTICKSYLKKICFCTVVMASKSEFLNVWRDSLQWGYPVFCLISKLLKDSVRKTVFLLIFGQQL
jgi:hypothetical protein